MIENIFVIRDGNIETAHKFVKELHTLFPDDLMTGLMISAFSGTKDILIYTSFVRMTEEYATAIQKLVDTYQIGVVNFCEVTLDIKDKLMDELFQADIFFIGLFDIDNAFNRIQNRWINVMAGGS